MDERLRTRLAAGGVIALDGGLATTLEASGADLGGPLWSARLLLEAPDAVRDAHASFLAAGAEVVLTASYQLSARGLRAAGSDPGLEAALLAESATLAREAVDAAGGHGRVAGSLGPFGAALADGSEYTGRYGVDAPELVAFHAPRIGALASAGVDLLAIETVPSGEEVAVVADLLAGTGTDAWVSVTLAGDGTRLPEGQPLLEALAPAAAVEEVVAVGVNCCPPHLVVAALEALAPLGVPLVAKPNAGSRWDPARRHWGRPSTPVDPRPWVEAGARLVGGCCGTSPEDLAALVAALPGRSPQRPG